MNVIIRAIQERRLQKGYNFHDIEQATGIPAKRMHSFEKGLTHLSIDEVDRLFQFLQLTHEDVTQLPKAKRKPNTLLYSAMATLIFVSIAIFTLFYFQNESVEPTNESARPPINTTLDTQEPTSESQIGASNENPIADNAGDALPSASDTAHVEGTVLRFWGTVDYRAEQEQLPSTPTSNGNTPYLEIYPIERLSLGEQLPAWLVAKEHDRVLLNFATRNIRGTEMVKERDRLNKLGIKNVGLDYRSEVYKPYKLHTEDGTIGILPFTKVILQYEDIAQQDRIGLARVHDNELLLQAVRDAKNEVDFLVVLMGWGKFEDIKSSASQQELAQQITAAGADLIIGNHSLYGQEIDWIDDVPVLYSLGRMMVNQEESIDTVNGSGSNQGTGQGGNPETGQEGSRQGSEKNVLPQEGFVYMVDVEIRDAAISKVTLYPGISKNGIISFDLNDEQKALFKQTYFSPEEKVLQLP